jgi:LuxR family transcriptional regulator, maltose regulon positive regulatory protein
MMASGDPPPFLVIPTKIQPPRRRSELLLRNRLVNQLYSMMDRRLIVLTAPAGYGKTSLLVDFAAGSELPVCWLTLDTFDRDPLIFLENFISAISSQFPAFGKKSRRALHLQGSISQHLQVIATTVVQEIQDTIPEYFVLILDDYHTVDDQDFIAEFLDTFLVYADENTHLIVASRNLVPLQNLVLLIARRQAAGLSVDELRFTPRELQALALQNYTLDLDPGEADHLFQQTSGWITGVLLSTDPYWSQGQVKIQQSGRINQDIYDYLTTQLYNDLPADLRQFLLLSSVLDEVDAQTCSKILKIENAVNLISQVRTRNLFVADYEVSGGVLRYNDLFREFLRARYQFFDPTAYRQSVLDVAGYHVARHEWDRAIERYLELGENGEIVAILSQIASGYFDAGRWDILTAWLDALPPDALIRAPSLLIQRAKIYAERGQYSQALDTFDRAERCLSSGKSDLVDHSVEKSEIARVLVFKGSVLRFQEHHAECIAHCQQALVLVGETSAQDRQIRALALKNIGLCWLYLGRAREGQAALLKSLRNYSLLSSLQDIGMIHHDMGLARELAGDLDGAAEHYNTALSYWEQIGNPSPWANELNSLGVVCHLKGDLDGAQSALTQAFEKSCQAGDLRVQAFILASLADVFRDLGNLQQASRRYEQALEIAHRANLGMIITYALDGLGNLSRVAGDLKQARFRLEDAYSYASEHGTAYELSLCLISLGILAHETGRLDDAFDHLDQAVDISTNANLPQHLSRAYLHRAQSSFLAGDHERAWQDLRRSLEQLGELCYNQFLVFDSRRLLNLLHAAIAVGIDGACLKDLIHKAQDIPSAVLVEAPTEEASASPPSLVVHTLGKPEVIMDGKEVHWELQKSRDLFFLLLQNHQGLTRDQIGVIFWPDYNPERLEPAFRSTMYRLRRALYRDSVLFLDGLYRFNFAAPLWQDCMEFEDRLDKAETTSEPELAIPLLEEALNIYRGDYLQGNYDDWCGLERERLRNRWRYALEQLAMLHTSQNRFDRAIELYLKLTRQDPYHESAHRELIHCYALSGDRASAIQHYQFLVRLLWDELGLRPDPQTEALYFEIID